MKSRIELIEDYEMTPKIKNGLKIINYMADAGHFKIQEEYDKAHNMVVKGIIPEYLKKDMEIYYNKMKEEK